MKVIIQNGKSFEIKGQISSNKSLYSVVAEVYNGSTRIASSNTWYSLNKTTASLDLQSSIVNTTLKFATLPVGSYTIKLIIVHRNRCQNL